MSRRYCLDARTATNHFPGIGRYVSNLAQAVVPLLAADEHLILLTDPTRPSRWQLPPESEKVTWVETAVSPFSLAQQTQIPKLLRENSINLYHSPYYLMPYRPGVPTLLTIYDLIPQLLPQLVSARARLLFRLTTRLALRAADHVITISEATRRDLLAVYALEPERVTAVPLAPAPQFRPQPPAECARIRQTYHLPDSYVLYFGINKPHKNITQLVRAWPLVMAEMARPPVLVIAGAWDARYPEAKQLAAELGLSDNVRFLGPLPDEDVPPLYAGADLFLFPSQYEGFGLPVAEAMACGTAVACAHTSSLPEVGGEAAFYFNPHHTGEIAGVICHALEDKTALAARKQQSLAQAAQFSWEKTAVMTLNLYRKWG